MEAARRSQGETDETAAMQRGFRTPRIGEMSRLFPELEILRLVGRGGMGAVFEVRQKNLDRIVALKVFLYKPGDPEFAARFQREARALAKLNHPNIITVHDFGEREHLHYLVMEFVDGLNLRQVTSEEKLSPEMALQMVPQLCDALQYAHDRGVIHRDIKPENLLLDTSGRIKIADFGLAKLTGSGNQGTLTHTRQVMGTLNYMAPEQRERPTEVDHRADIYSLGVVIYEMLTGELPIGRFQAPSKKSHVDTRLDEVVMRALEKEPELRYQQASELKTGFESVGNFTEGYIPARAPIQPVKSFDGSPVYSENTSRVMVSLLSGREKKGNWRPGNPQIALTFMGGTHLDLTDVDATDVNLTLLTLMGGVEVTVPHGAIVDLDGFMLMGATVDNVARSKVPSNMRVRIRSWGAMGGCEVSTPDELPAQYKEPPSPAPAYAETQQYRHPPEHDVSLSASLVMLYKTIATLACIAIPIIFLLAPFDILDEDESIMIGIITAIGSGFLWASLGYFRRIVGAGPEKNDQKSIREYYSSTVIGTLIRSFGLMLGFACPILFIVATFQKGHDDETLQFAAIICAILCGLTYAFAGYVEEFFHGKKKV